MDAVYKALADPTRRDILRLLKDGEKTAGQLAERFDISGPSMSHHFNLLKAADLVFTRREGQQIFYALNTTVFQDVLTAIMDLLHTGEPVPDRPDTESGRETAPRTRHRKGES
ncbi:MAG: autorepressor SdpR family transcription factor [Armatimonadetes bacterium]|nr:autorepressor SdpR family transcription factor [Armatimonadota bacterium]